MINESELYRNIVTGRSCGRCGKSLIAGNWSNSRKAKDDYICKSCESSRYRDWAAKNKERLRVSSLAYYVKNIDRERLRRNDVMLKLKKDCMSRLGGKCVGCGIDDIRVLTLEHLRGGGAAEYRKYGKGQVGHGKGVLYRLIRDGKVDLSNYQCLCVNCNMKKRIGIEHKETKGSKYHQKLKRDVMTMLGSRCVSCGIDDLDELTLEHNYGFGRNHLLQLNRGKNYSAMKLYGLIRRGLEPLERYSALCFNCNFKEAQKWRDAKAREWRKY